MGKPKTQRTDELKQAAKRYVIAEEVQDRIEQHKFDRLVKVGVIVRDKAIEALKRDKDRFFVGIIIKALS